MTAGFMSPTLPQLPRETCSWAWSGEMALSFGLIHSQGHDCGKEHDVPPVRQRIGRQQLNAFAAPEGEQERRHEAQGSLALPGEAEKRSQQDCAKHKERSQADNPCFQ
jgi:hypothetical protein